MLVEIFVNTVLIFVPSAVTALIITTAINAAIIAYSIAVTPDSSFIKLVKRVLKLTLLQSGNRLQKTRESLNNRKSIQL